VETDSTKARPFAQPFVQPFIQPFIRFQEKAAPPASIHA
jgi:hypothetical protein